MTARFRVTPTMLYKAQRDVMRQIPWMHWGGYFVVLAFPLLLIGITVASGGNASDAFTSYGGLMIVLPVFWLVGIPLVTRWTAGRTLRSTPGFQGEIVYSLSESGLDIQSEVATSHLGWAAFTRATETSDFFLLFQSKAMAVFIPKACLSGPAELNELRGLVARGLGPRAKVSATALASAT